MGLEMNELQTAEIEILGQRPLFDYASLDAETRIVVQQRAGEIKSIAKRMAADVVEIGEKLADVKQRLGPNDRFNDWLAAELGWSQRSAHNFISVWRRFGSANFAIENVAVSALYALAAPSTPAEAIEEVKRIADRGQEVTNTDAKGIIKKAKAKRPKQVGLDGAVDPSAICLCGCRAGAHTRVRGQYGECCECDCEIFQQATEEEIAERNAAEKALGIIWSKSPVPPPGVTPTTETIARLKTEMGLEEEEEEKASRPAAPAVIARPASVSVEKRPIPAKSLNDFFPRPKGWYDTEIDIRIRLMPGGDEATRKIRYEVRVDESNEGEAFTAEDYGEAMLFFNLPAGAYKLVEQAAAAFIPGSAPTKDPKQMRREALARYRGVPVETVNLDDEEYDEGFHQEFPPGFDANRAENGLAHIDDPETLRNLLALLIEGEIPIEAIRRWTGEQKRQAQEWARAAHLRASDQEVEVQARPEILQACICGELGYEHAGGVCMLDGCGCQQWRPANYAQCPRCKGEIVTLANPKDFDGLCLNCRIAEEDARRSFPQEEINRIARFNAAGILGEGKPIKICTVLDNPYVITGSVGSGDAKNYQRVWAYPIRPLSEVGEENARDYQEAYAEYRDRLQRSISDDSVSYQPLSYQNVKINCGTKKKPDWWVIVGEQMEFTVDYCADYPDDEIEARPDDEQEDYQAEWRAGLSREERERYDNEPCSCGCNRGWHVGAGGACTGCLRGKCDQFHCSACGMKEGHKANCKYYVVAEGKPIPGEPPYQEVSQADVNMMAEYYAVNQIEEGKPVRICYIDGKPHVITGCMGGGDAENWESADAWPIAPLAEVGEENAKTYEDAERDYYAGDVSDPDHVFSYKGIKINCGSKKNPVWYVITGQVTVFKVNYSADYPDNEIEEPAIDRALHAALHHTEGAEERWRPLIEKGATDTDLMAAIGREFGLGGGSGRHGGWRHKGGKRPQFSWPGYADMSRAQTLKGKRLLAKAREVLGIGAPGQSNDPNADHSAVYPDDEIEMNPLPYQGDDEGEDSVAPFPTEFSQAEINSFGKYYAGQQIMEGKPVKICHVLGRPYVITGAVRARNGNWQRVIAWPILPLANVGEQNAKTYEQARDEYWERIDKGGPDNFPPYEGVKVNCGSKREPDWRVMVGPEMAFTVKDAPKRSKRKTEATPLYDPFCACGHVHVALGCSEDDCDCDEFRPVPSALEVVTAACTGAFKGGHQVNSPRLAAPPDGDDFTAPRCSECGRIDGAHTPECSQNPNTLTFEDYLAYAEFTKPKAPSSWARKWTLSREMDGAVQSWKLYWKELEDSGVIPFLQLCMCGHPLPKHKPEVGCEGKLGDQDCQCVTFVASAEAEAEAPKLAKKGRGA